MDKLVRVEALSQEVSKMARSNGNNGNGDGELGTLASVISLPEKRLGKGAATDLGEATGRMTATVIPGGSLFLDLIPLARLSKRKGFSVYGGKERELLASCPECKTFETLWFKGDVLTPTKRFAQGLDQRVYHDCGSHKPCWLFPKCIEEWSATTKSENLPGYLTETLQAGVQKAVCAAR